MEGEAAATAAVTRRDDVGLASSASIDIHICAIGAGSAAATTAVSIPAGSRQSNFEARGQLGICNPFNT